MDRDKVLQALNCCEGHDSHCWAMNPKCPYWREDGKHANYGFPRCFDDMKEDVFALLKEQKSVEPHEGKDPNESHWDCGECGYPLWEDEFYCAHCGRKIKWD